MWAAYSRRWPERFEPKVTLHKDVIVTALGPAFAGTLPLPDTFYRYPLSVAKGAGVAVASLVRRPPKQASIEQPVAFIHSQWTRGYYHWMTESLPRALAVKAVAGDVTILLPRSYSSFHGHSLNLLGLRYAYFPSHNVRIPRGYITSCAKHFGTTAPEVLQDLRALLRKAGPQAPHRPRRLYISRRKARGRRVLNEDEILAVLSKFGFVEVVAEDLSFSEQVSLFSHCEYLIGIHGAGLTNMLCMPSGSRVIELLAKKNGLVDLRPNTLSLRYDNCYIELAEALNHTYDRLFCDHGAGKFARTGLADISVDCDALSRKVDALLDLKPSPAAGYEPVLCAAEKSDG